ncbi:V-ATPase V1 sector subunit E [Ascosphaera pollenicola]|nr:V-ATPase V1 sector subunit E [Ascosphaera pollenicola]
MAARHALSDDQVAGELRKMTAFIRQEALEKAREIELKADEEFAIEKSRLVREETASIDSLYEKKFKQAAMAQQIVKSTLANKTRIRVLSARQELLDDLFDQARSHIASAAGSGKFDYNKALTGLILEGLYTLNETKVSLKARRKDYDQVRKAIEKAKPEFKEKTGKDVLLTLDEEEPLPESSAGGIVVIGGNGKIEINNTFEERLKLLETDALPSIRETLFGKNPNRKFYD